jgi:hypothetical protein
MNVRGLSARGRQTFIAIALWTGGGAIYLAWYTRRSIVDWIDASVLAVVALVIVSVALMVTLRFRHVMRQRALTKVRVEHAEPGRAL